MTNPQSKEPDIPDTYITDPVKAEHMAYAEKPYREDVRALDDIIERADKDPLVAQHDRAKENPMNWYPEPGEEDYKYADTLRSARESTLELADRAAEEMGKKYDEVKQAAEQFGFVPQINSEAQQAVEQDGFELQINSDLQGFQSVQVTKTTKVVEVTKADGSVYEVDANTPYAVFKDDNGYELTVSVKAVGHIDKLHIKGAEPGSKFDIGSIDELMRIVGENLPNDIARTEGVSAFSVETGRPMGEEGVASLDELLEKGLIAHEDIEGLVASRDQISQLNLEGSAEDKDTFVTQFNETYADSKIKLQLVRGGVIVPTANVPKQPTTKLFMVFGPSETGKTMYTMAPGRFMPKMPNVAEHTAPDGVVNYATFKESSDAWLNTVMLTG